MRRFLLAAALTAILAAGAAAPTTQATPLPQAATCSGVWVVVDFGSRGGTSTKCAPSGGFGTGVKALKSAGFSVTSSDGFILKIGAKPSNPDPNTAYWSYWHATRKPDGTYSAWSYSTLGADAYHPGAGNAEGWRYQKLSDGKVPPGVEPPVATTPSPTPTPKPTRTSTKPSAKPTRTATKTAPASTPATATATRTATTKETVAASATPSPTPSATTATTPTPLGANEATSPPPADRATPDAGDGSPAGLIAAGVVIVLAGGGLGGWWLRKGRRP